MRLYFADSTNVRENTVTLQSNPPPTYDENY